MFSIYDMQCSGKITLQQIKICRRVITFFITIFNYLFCDKWLHMKCLFSTFACLVVIIRPLNPMCFVRFFFSLRMIINDRYGEGSWALVWRFRSNYLAPEATYIVLSSHLLYLCSDKLADGIKSSILFSYLCTTFQNKNLSPCL